MDVLGKVVATCKGFYQELNSANLSGAIDVIVVRQPDGILRSTPFHVRFGKMGVLRPGDLQKKVEIEVNGDTVPLHMKLDETGSAFFVEHDAATPSGPEGKQLKLPQDFFEEGDSTPTNLPRDVSYLPHNHPPHITSSQSDVSLPVFQEDDASVNNYMLTKSRSVPLEERGSKDSDCVFQLSDGEDAGGEGEGRSEKLDDSMEMAQPRRRPGRLDKVVAMHNMSHSLPDDYHALSDSESYTQLKSLEDSTSIHSDTELETGIFRKPSMPTEHQSVHERRRPSTKRDGFFSSMMNLFRKKQITDEDEIYLEDIENECLPPEERSRYFPPRAMSTQEPKGASVVSSDECDSGVGGDRSPVSRRVVSAPSSPLRDTPLSTPPPGWRQEQSHMESMISPLKGLELSLCGPLKDSVEEELFARHRISFERFAESPDLLMSPNLVVRMEGQYYTWTTVAPVLMSILVYHQPLPKPTVERLLEAQTRKQERGRLSYWFSWGRKGPAPVSPSDDTTPVVSPTSTTTPISVATPTSRTVEQVSSVSSDEGEELETITKKLPRQQSFKRKRKKSLYLPSEQLEKLNLKEGVNEAVFSVTTRFQGTCRAECSIFLWDYQDKIVVSDIDGTITRSDVAGQILPMLGRDWTQAGVVDLYNGVARNGYKFVYLSARPIGYAGATRGYLKWIRQSDQSLPDGPLLVAPLSLLKAFAKEVIEKKPEEFKIACLKELQRLFPKGRNPFYAGFGNKITDETSYKAVDIPSTRMYTINPKGELKNSFNLVFKSSYKNLKDYIDHMFPPREVVEQVDGGMEGEEFSTLNYWRRPILNFDLPEDIV
jgi:phosphatidate phosphatase LPIN